MLSLLETEDAVNVAMRTVDFMMIKIDVGFNQEMVRECNNNNNKMYM